MVIPWSAKWMGMSTITLLTFNNCAIQDWQADSEPSTILVKTEQICPFEGMELTYQISPPLGATTVTPETLKAMQTVFARRLEALKVGTTAIVALDNTAQLQVQFPGTADPQRVERLLGQTGQLDFRAQKPGTEAQLAVELQTRQALLARQETLRNSGDRAAIDQSQKAIQQQNQTILSLFAAPTLTGQNIKDARSSNPDQGLTWVVTITFDDQGTIAFANLTQKLAGTGRSLGVFLDGALLSAPMVPDNYAKTGITGGRAELTGNFTKQQVRDLSIQLRSGILPAPVKLIEIKTVRRDRQCELLKS